MQIQKKSDGDKLLLEVSGRVDTTTAPELESCINESTKGVKELVLDLKDMAYISSAGLRVMLKAHKLMSAQGSLIIKNVQSDVMEVFEMTGFSDILRFE
ncbi:MAG: STAS domain-containing protein [Clostridia bacterium]|nr:STAS domain-containing protein [Clostridia bacterium]